MENLSPMMRQWFEAKKEYPDCLLFFRLGDFYEMFFDDAAKAGKELELVITGRDCGMGERAPMCGVPHNSVQGYISRLVAKGYKVAVCDQMEEAGRSKLVRREVTRVVTPGTNIDASALDESRNNYILSVYAEKGGFGVSVCDLSIGEFQTTSLKPKKLEGGRDDGEKRLIDEIARFNPAEVIANSDFTSMETVNRVFPNAAVYYYSDERFSYGNAYLTLLNHFRALNLNGYGLEGAEAKNAVSAAGALLSYLLETQKNGLPHITGLRFYHGDSFMMLDASSRRNLEITQNTREGTKKGSLLGVLDRTRTALGARLLRKWLEAPLVDAEKIRERLAAVEEFYAKTITREEIFELLSDVHDIERILGRLNFQSANARDMAQLKNSIKNMPTIKTKMRFFKNGLNAAINADFDDLEDIFAFLEATIAEDPPFTVRDGGLIKRGVDAELDKLYDIKEHGAEWLMRLEETERVKTGIKTLRVKFHKVLGYCFEVTNSYKKAVPPYFERRQTISNLERYTSAELREIETEIITADDKIKEIEYRLFCEAKAALLRESERISRQAGRAAVIDALASFAEAAELYGYVKPEINDGETTEIKNGRHPVVERVNRDTFVPNDALVDCEDNRLCIITGPNMGGKSTFMRQTALITLMAQAGCFVPATYARISVVDRIFTRVGASDDLVTGQSTYMVEMSEVANILNNATRKSLIILDEIGRGTSTYDGLATAWALVEHFACRLGAKTLFATHYHELTVLEEGIQGVRNYHVTVSEENGGIVFLRKIESGFASSSYGIQVARLAGLPESVINRAQSILGTIASDSGPEEAHKAVYYGGKIDRGKNKLIINEFLDMDLSGGEPLADAFEKLRALQKVLSAYKFPE
ncbi:MAG: DNA mismatch repair protein MutS [Clostridiales bacterium]|jgi:DNA mismatch repair protein MutS|nr:DNA mismatch repair protein MutS [Clostridiales bacterium]